LGFVPKMMTGEYSSLENLKFLKTRTRFHMGITKNRKVSLDGIEYTQVKNLKIPDTGLVVHLKNFGRVKVFRRTFTNVAERYITYLFDSDAVEQISRQEFNQWHSIHWELNVITEL